MRFTTVLLVAVSAATSSFALSKAGGDATYYNPGLGSCGISSTDSEFVVAVDAQTIQTFPGAGTNPNLNPMCGRQMRVTYQTKSVTVKVVDTCPSASCKVGSLDLSPAAFQKLAPLSVGRLHGISWALL